MSGATASILLALTLGSTACGSDPTSVTVERVVGDYEATVLQIQDVDVLAAGGHLHLSLARDSTVSGELFVPESLGGPTSVDMSGTFRIQDGFVAFGLSQATFLDRVPLMWYPGGMGVSWESDFDRGVVRLVRR